MVDDVTYHNLMKKELKKDSLMPKWKIENTKMAIEALHHNLFCNEVEITFDGYSTDFEGTRCLYDARSRDTLIKEAYEDKQKDKNLMTETFESESVQNNNHSTSPNKPIAPTS